MVEMTIISDHDQMARKVMYHALGFDYWAERAKDDVLQIEYKNEIENHKKTPKK